MPEHGQGLEGGGLVRALLIQAFTTAVQFPGDRDLADEPLLVVRTSGLDYRIQRGLLEDFLGDFL